MATNAREVLLVGSVALRPAVTVFETVEAGELLQKSGQATMLIR